MSLSEINIGMEGQMAAVSRSGLPTAKTTDNTPGEQSFLSIMDYANELLGSPQSVALRAGAEGVFSSESADQMVLSHVVDFTGRLPSSRKREIKINPKDIANHGAGVTIMALHQMSDRLTEVFGGELLTYGGTSHYSQSGRETRTIKGIDGPLLATVEKRFDEAEALRNNPVITAEDRKGLGVVAPRISDFVDSRAHRVPMPGLMTMRQNVCVFSALEIDRQAKRGTDTASARRWIVQDTVGDFLRFMRIAAPPKRFNVDPILQREEYPVVHGLGAGACKGMEVAVFYPEESVKVTVKFSKEEKKQNDIHKADAKAICQECSVRADCLYEALVNEYPVGIWGGHTTRERNGMIKQAKKKNTSAVA